MIENIRLTNNGISVTTKSNHDRMLLYKSEVEVKTRWLNDLPKKQRISQYGRNLQEQIAKARRNYNYYARRYDSESAVLDYNTVVAISCTMVLYAQIIDLQQYLNMDAEVLKARKALDAVCIVIREFAHDNISQERRGKARKEHEKVQADNIISAMDDRLYDRLPILTEYICDRLEAKFKAKVKESQRAMELENVRNTLRQRHEAIPAHLHNDIAQAKEAVSTHQREIARQLTTLAYMTAASQYVLECYGRDCETFGYNALKENNPIIAQCKRGISLTADMLKHLDECLCKAATNTFQIDRGAFQAWLDDALMFRLYRDTDNLWWAERCDDNNFKKYIHGK